MNAWRLYRRYIATSMKGQLQYRVSFVMMTIGVFLMTGIDFVGIWALFDRFGQIRGWRLPEIALFYGMISTTWAITDGISRGFDVFGDTVKAGDFDRVLLRPRSTVLQLLGQEITLRRIGRLAQGMIVLGYAVSALDVEWTAWRFGLIVFAIACGICVFMGLIILQATTAFWTTETLEVWNAFTYGGVTMGHYPLAIYRRWFRSIFLYIIPIGCTGYLPGLAILDRADVVGAPLFAPLAGPGFLAISLLVWRVGVRHYRSTGS